MGKCYFLADVHLGLQVGDTTARERRLVDFLEGLDAAQTEAVFLLGDIFDFWYEYKYVIPRGHTRVLGALIHLTDRGIPVHFFTGNHDIWTYGYLAQELGLQVHRGELYITLGGKHFLLAHGDTMGRIPGKARFLFGLFRSPWAQVPFSAMHPRWGMALGLAWSKHNRLAKGVTYTFRNEAEPVFQYAAAYPKPVDYCIIGHFHSPAECVLPGGGTLLVLGDWINNPDVIVFETAPVPSSLPQIERIRFRKD